jgi:hypothetical protein
MAKHQISWFKVGYSASENPLGEPLKLQQLAERLDVNQERGFLLYVQVEEDGSKNLYFSPVAVLYFADLLIYSWRGEECDAPTDAELDSFDLVYGRF